MKSRFRTGMWLVLASLIGLGMLTAPAQAALFQNGSFETGTLINSSFDTLYGGNNTSIAGWTVGGHSIDYIGGYWQAAQGSRSIDLNGLGTGSISQTFDTVLNRTYAVSFYMAGNPDGAPGQKILTASAGDASGLNFNFDTSNKTKINMGWTQHVFNFVALGTSTTLTFATGIEGYYGPALDNIDVSPVPIPGALVLFGSGLVGLVLAGRRRRSRT